MTQDDISSLFDGGTAEDCADNVAFLQWVLFHVDTQLLSGVDDKSDETVEYIVAEDAKRTHCQVCPETIQRFRAALMQVEGRERAKAWAAGKHLVPVDYDSFDEGRSPRGPSLSRDRQRPIRQPVTDITEPSL
jgi:hypothetical protein